MRKPSKGVEPGPHPVPKSVSARLEVRELDDPVSAGVWKGGVEHPEPGPCCVVCPSGIEVEIDLDGISECLGLLDALCPIEHRHGADLVADDAEPGHVVPAESSDRLQNHPWGRCGPDPKLPLPPA